MRTVAFYLDFVSPYTWLALMQAEGFAERHGVRFELRPVVYAALLDAHGLIGPVETPAKRRYTLHDVARSANSLGLALVGPPRHPFRSLEALRTLMLFRGDPLELRLAVLLSDACWGEGRELTDGAVLEEVVARAGLAGGALADRIGLPEIKSTLRRATAQAAASGVFGVPTFALGDELFWGHDRLAALARRLDGEPPPAARTVNQLIARPSGAERMRSST